MIAGRAMKLVMWKEGTSNPELLRENRLQEQAECQDCLE